VTNDNAEEPIPTSGGGRIQPIDASGGARVFPYPRLLLADAQRLMSGGDHSYAVVVAHIAAEVAMEHRLAEALQQKGLLFLEDFFRLNNRYDRLRLYGALTSDKVLDEQPIWEPLNKSAKIRNRIIHEGHLAAPEEAEEACRVVEAFLARLNF
jgi:hypothetical protein